MKEKLSSEELNSIAKNGKLIKENIETWENHYRKSYEELAKEYNEDTKKCILSGLFLITTFYLTYWIIQIYIFHIPFMEFVIVSKLLIIIGLILSGFFWISNKIFEN